MAKSYTHMDETEKRLATGWLQEGGMSQAEVARLLKRSRGTIHKFCASEGLVGVPVGPKKQPKGRPVAITPAIYRKLKSALDTLLRQAKGEREVTVAMVKEKAQCEASTRRILESFHAKGIWFRKLREKPILTKEDFADRAQFGRRHAMKSKSQWCGHPHAIIDNKTFPIYLNAAGREHAARRCVRGAFRSGADALKPHLVKPKGTVKFPAPSVMVTAAVIKGRVRMWHVVRGPWNGQAAADMYEGPLRKAVEKAYPGKRCWTVMEDNDPAGYKSRKGMDAKRRAKLVSLDLPKRSPDCNPLDYSLWRAINNRMRSQEKAFSKTFKETKPQYLQRLRGVAMSLPTSVVKKAVGDMRRRVKELVDKKGGLIAE